MYRTDLQQSLEYITGLSIEELENEWRREVLKDLTSFNLPGERRSEGLQPEGELRKKVFEIYLLHSRGSTDTALPSDK